MSLTCVDSGEPMFDGCEWEIVNPNDGGFFEVSRRRLAIIMLCLRLRVVIVSAEFL